MGNTLAKRSTTAKTKKAAASSRRRTAPSRGVIRNFKAALNFLNEHTDYEKMLRVGYNHTNFNLSRMQRILAGVGNPHRNLRCIHIAGTKGKGSTAHMVNAMLQGGGYRTGLYTSPHVNDLRERIVVGQDRIPEAAFARALSQVAPVARKLDKERPTFFELMTAVAFLYFAEQAVDFAVIETGLGGRLDSTNVIKPEAIGITSISFDHMAQLGNTLEAIAEEKAGVFKPGVTVISAPQPAGVRRVFKQVAEKVGCPLRFVGDDLEFSYRFESSRLTGPHTRICMATKASRFDHVRVPLLGEHQAINCGVALGIIDALREKGVDIGEQPAIDGLAHVHVEGRLELIRSQPRTVVDAAHNAASIRALMRAIGQNIGYDSMVVIFGCSADKDIDGMLNQLQIGADKVIFTSTGTPRSADPRELHARFLEKTQKMAQCEPNLLDAYRTATHCVTREDLICITGSFHLIGQAKRVLTGTDLPG